LRHHSQKTIKEKNHQYFRRVTLFFTSTKTSSPRPPAPPFFIIICLFVFFFQKVGPDYPTQSRSNNGISSSNRILDF